MGESRSSKYYVPRSQLPPEEVERLRAAARHKYATDPAYKAAKQADAKVQKLKRRLRRQRAKQQELDRLAN